MKYSSKTDDISSTSDNHAIMDDTHTFRMNIVFLGQKLAAADNYQEKTLMVAIPANLELLTPE
jgi:hypothetical protein